MTASELAAAVEHLPAGWYGRYFDQVSSTQDEARRAAAAGAPSRSVFVADFQSAGRGRHARAWQAQPGEALLVSILLRQDSPTARPWRSTALAAVALAEAIEHVVPPLGVAIKWPNDLLLDGRKVAGILAEAGSDGLQTAVVVGAGTNVNTPNDDLERIGVPATSLRAACGHLVDRAELLLAFVARLDYWLARAEPDLRDRWQERLWGRGQKLRLADVDLDEEVVVLGATIDGALRVRLLDGTERVTTTAEIIL
jgi:BirA family biotin operon repressor/biotin-[acetyl-CoA-carboxylase] ligase